MSVEVKKRYIKVTIPVTLKLQAYCCNNWLYGCLTPGSASLTTYGHKNGVKQQREQPSRPACVSFGKAGQCCVMIMSAPCSLLADLVAKHCVAQQEAPASEKTCTEARYYRADSLADAETTSHSMMLRLLVIV